MAIMTSAQKKKSMLAITYGDPTHNCQCTPGSSCNYCGSSRRGRRQGRTHISASASDTDLLHVTQVFGNLLHLGGADDSKGSHRGGSSDGYSPVTAIPADPTLHQGTRFPCSVYYGQRRAAPLIDAGRQFNSVQKSDSNESYPIPIVTYPDPHSCKSYPCPYCGKGNWWGCITSLLHDPTSWRAWNSGRRCREAEIRLVPEYIPSSWFRN